MGLLESGFGLSRIVVVFLSWLVLGSILGFYDRRDHSMIFETVSDWIFEIIQEEVKYHQ